MSCKNDDGCCRPGETLMATSFGISILKVVNVGSKLQRPRSSHGRDSMTFDQLWRMNLAEDKRRTDSGSGSGSNR
jgi:hypothetical protein